MKATRKTIKTHEIVLKVFLAFVMALMTKVVNF